MEYAIVIGGGKVGKYVAQRLIEKNFEVKIIEKTASKIDNFKDHTVIGDACDLLTLEKAHADKANVLVVTTGEDQTNLVVSLLGKTEFGIPKIIARINDPNDTWLFTTQWGVDASISMPEAMVRMIDKQLSTYISK